MASAEHLEDENRAETLENDARAKSSFARMKVAEKDEAPILVLALRDALAVSVVLGARCIWDEVAKCRFSMLSS